MAYQIKWEPTQCNLFLWSFVKSKVYDKNPQTRPELKEEIETIINKKQPDSKWASFQRLQNERVVENFKNHMTRCHAAIYRMLFCTLKSKSLLNKILWKFSISTKYGVFVDFYYCTFKFAGTYEYYETFFIMSSTWDRLLSIEKFSFRTFGGPVSKLVVWVWWWLPLYLVLMKVKWTCQDLSEAR